MAVERQAPAEAGRQIRAFRINLAIFLGVNAVLLTLGLVLLVAGVQFGGELWPYPLLMALWGLRVAFQGYRAYHRDTTER